MPCHSGALVLVALVTAATLMPLAAIAQSDACSPNPTSGCALEFGEPTLAAITDPADPAHVWRLNLPSEGSFGVVLTNLPARYRLSVYPPGAERPNDVLEQSTPKEGEYLFVTGASPGVYTILVDSPFYETSDSPYALLAVRMLEIGDTISNVISDPSGFRPWLIDIPGEMSISIALTNLQVDYDLSLYALTGDLIGRSDLAGSADDVITISGLAAGYYLAVVTAEGATSPTPYRLAVTAGSAGAERELIVAPPAQPVAAAPPVGPAPPVTTAPPTAGPLTETEIAAEVSPAMVQVVTPYSLGSGVRIAQGILTNEHLVSGADRVEVVRSDGRRVRATPLRCDSVLDLALIAVELDLPAVELAPARSQRPGDQVLVLGYPRPDVLSGQSTLTRGLISAVRADQRGKVVVQIDVADNPGSSGGPMVNDRGRLIALTSFTFREARAINLGIGSESIQAFLQGPGNPCSNGAPPGTVLISDSFADPVDGVLPLASLSPSRYVSRYSEGEYQIQLADATWTGLPAAVVPGSYTDASIAIDARVAGNIPGRVLSIGCRDPDGSGGYALLVEPGNTRSILVRYDSTGSGSGTPTSLTAWQSSPSIWTGNNTNRLELSCVGSTITATINGTQVASIHDTTFPAGQMWIAAATGTGTVDARFDNLVVTRR